MVLTYHRPKLVRCFNKTSRFRYLAAREKIIFYRSCSENLKLPWTSWPMKFHFLYFLLSMSGRLFEVNSWQFVSIFLNNFWCFSKIFPTGVLYNLFIIICHGSRGFAGLNVPRKRAFFPFSCTNFSDIWLIILWYLH